MPISPAELREVLRGDIVSLGLCGLLLILGVLALAMTGILGRRAVPLLWIAAFACLYGVRLLIPHRHLSFLRRYVTGDVGLRGRGHHLHGADSDRAVCAFDLSDLAAFLDHRRGWPDGVRRLCHHLGCDPAGAVLRGGRQQSHRDCVLRRGAGLDPASRARAVP